ncbi:MAG: response regulator [Flavobacterium sp.]|jgi:two-component system response regulator LytT
MMKTPLKILVVEDEFITQKTICNYLNEIGYNVVGTALNSDKALEILKNNNVDFAILDINIKGDQNGIWLANHIIQNYSIPHLFLTAYSDTETIKEALKTEPLGYLVKPFQKHDLFTAIEIAVLNYSKSKANKKDTLLLKHNEIFVKIEIEKILFIESDKNYLIINHQDGTYRYRSTISDFVKELPSNFIKTHKGFIVNIEKISGFTNTQLYIDNFKIPISKTFKEFVFKKLQS